MKNKIMSLLTILCITLSSAAFGDNKVKRNSCTSFGCSTVPVQLTLSWPGETPETKTIYCPDAGQNYDEALKKINVKVSGKTSTGDYSLPTTMGSSTLIPASELDFGTYGYGVTITKTGIKQFTLTMTRYDYPTP